MNVRKLLTVGVACLMWTASAPAAQVQRIHSGGLWSDPNDWSTGQVPGVSDDVIHGTQASNVVTYDSGVSPANRRLHSMSAVAGDNRGLIIDSGLDLTVDTDFTRSSGTGAYVTELKGGSSLIVGGSIVRGNWIVGTDAIVDVNDIVLGPDTLWRISGGEVDVAGGVSTTGGSFYVDDGVLSVDGATAEFSVLRVNASGRADFAGDVRAAGQLALNGGTLTAATVNMAPASPIGGNLLEITGGGSMIVAGTLYLKDSTAAGHFDRLNYGTGSNVLTVGSLSIEGENPQLRALSVGSTRASLDLTVSGDIDIAATATAGTNVVFESEGVTLALNGGSDQDVEVWTPDYDIDPNTVHVVWQGLQKCGDAQIYNVMPIAALTVASDATVDLTDEHENILRGYGSPPRYTQDALFVDGDVTVQSGATLNLGSLRLYYTGTLTKPGTINGTYQQVSKICYGDFDDDGDVDPADFLIFEQAFSGSNSESLDPRCSSDLDGDVDTLDFGVFTQQYTGAGNPCPTSCGESASVGEPSIEDLAEWCLTYLSPAQCESFAETLYSLAESTGDTEDAAVMAELADLITAE